MAFHLSLTTISRGKGRSAAGACAYVTAGVATDDYTGDKLDYRRKAKPVSAAYFGTTAKCPQDFAHTLDAKEGRKNSVVAREIVVALPDIVPVAVRQQLAEALSEWLSVRYDSPVLCVVHKPSRHGDQRNHHAHIILGTRDSAGRKIRILDDRKTGSEEIKKIRAYASEQIRASVPPEERAKWSHESLAAQGVMRDAMRHEGPMVTGLRRKGLSPALLSSTHNDELRAALEERSAATSLRLLTEKNASETRRQKLLGNGTQQHTRTATPTKGLKI